MISQPLKKALRAAGHAPSVIKILRRVCDPLGEDMVIKASDDLRLLSQVFRKGVRLERGVDVLRSSIALAKTLSAIVKSSLGPKGLWKLIVRPEGEALVTSSGSTILRNLPLQHFAAAPLVEASLRQEAEVGDGTKQTCALACELILKAERLLEQNLGPSEVVDGYRLASRKALEVIDEVAVRREVNRGTLRDLLRYSFMGSFTSREAVELTSGLVAEASTIAHKLIAKGFPLDFEDQVEVAAIRGGSLSEARVVKGVVLKEYEAPESMPSLLRNAKIALLNCSLNIDRLVERSVKLSLGVRDYASLHKYREALRDELAGRVASSGARVAFFEGKVDEKVAYNLERRGIMVVEEVGWPKLYRLAKATGANVVPSVFELSESDVGTASLIERVKLGDERILVVEGLGEATPATVLIRGVSREACDEYERTVRSMLRLCQRAYEEPLFVWGGGAFEVEASLRLKRWSRSLSSRLQWAVEAFAEALEVIPEALAVSAGLDPLEALGQLRKLHAQGEASAGVDVEEGCVKSVGFMELACVKRAAIKHAVEASSLILKSDAVLYYSGPEKKEGRERPEGRGR
jgi:chaperonin GroEL (HSP60 family)